MSYIDNARVVGRLDGEIVSKDGGGPDWVSPFATPSALSAIQVFPVEGRMGASTPVAWVTPWVFTAFPFAYEPVGHGQFQLMQGVRTLVFRDAVILPGSQGYLTGDGPPIWGIQLHLIKGCRRARFVYWQYE